MITHKVATGLSLWLMERYDVYGFTTWWSTIYYRTEDHMKYVPLRKHEMCHIEQMKREGKVKFTIKYLWYNFKYGYIDNPYEKEARNAEYV